MLAQGIHLALTGLAIVAALCLGGWYVVHGQTEVGTVVAFVSGLSTIHDPWGDLVTWVQDFMVTSRKYELIASAVTEMAGSSGSAERRKASSGDGRSS